MEQISGAFYINLDRRLDRRKEIEAELGNLGVAYERFPAIKTIPGCIGCALSHLAVLKEARSRGYKNVLIFEDDFMPLVSKEEFWETLTKGLQEAPDYDVIMLGYAINKSEPWLHGETLQKVFDAQAGSGYLVNEKFYDTLISTWDTGLAQLIKTGEHWKYSCDVSWKPLQPRANWYAFTKRLGKQRASFADTGTSPFWADYKNA